jgi:hypothetical protein
MTVGVDTVSAKICIHLNSRGSLGELQLNNLKGASGHLHKRIGNEMISSRLNCWFHLPQEIQLVVHV